MKAKFLVPLVLFLAFAGFLAFGLTLNPREVPSPLIDKPVPAFSLARLDAPETRFGAEDMRGEVWPLSVRGSGGVACRRRRPVRGSLARQDVGASVGLPCRERRGDGGIEMRGASLEDETARSIQRARRWLPDHGDPYALSALDI